METDSERSNLTPWDTWLEKGALGWTQGCLIVPAMGEFFPGSRSHDHGHNQNHCCLCSLHPDTPGRHVTATLIPAGRIGISLGHKFFNECEGGGQKDALDHPYSCKFLDFGKCALRNPVSSHAECPSQGCCYWKQRARFICILDTPCQALGKNKTPDIRRTEPEETNSKSKKGLSLKYLLLDWQGGKTLYR